MQVIILPAWWKGQLPLIEMPSSYEQLYKCFTISLACVRLTHLPLVPHKCQWIIIGSDNGLSPIQHQAITWTNAGILLIGPIGTIFNEILIQIHTFSFKKIHLKMLSGKWRPFCLGHNALRAQWSRVCALINNIITKWFKCQWLAKMFASKTMRCLVSWFLIIYSASYCGHDFLSGILNINRPISQIPKCTCSIALLFSKSKIMIMGYILRESQFIRLLWKGYNFVTNTSFNFETFFQIYNFYYFDHFYKIQWLHLLLYVVFTYKWMFQWCLFSWQELTHTWVDKPRKVLLGMGCLCQYSCDYWINIYEDVISIKHLFMIQVLHWMLENW